jgi:glutathione peroxidase
MLWLFAGVLVLGLFYAFRPAQEANFPPLNKKFHELHIKSIDGKSDIDFAQFKGRKVLLFNTASECGFTPQLKDLEALQQKYKGKLVVIGFPCNQFGEQEPEENATIEKFCRNRYSVTFPLTEKIDVKGEKQHEVYQWLTRKQNNKKEDVNVRWNFGKFLVDEKGKWLAYFPSKTKPDDPAISAMIEK